MNEDDMEKVPYSSCSMARCFRKEHVVGNQEMCCCFLYFERKNFAVNFMLTSGRFHIDSSGRSYSHVKYLFRLCRRYLPLQRVLDVFVVLINLLQWVSTPLPWPVENCRRAFTVTSKLNNEDLRDELCSFQWHVRNQLKPAMSLFLFSLKWA